jgi:glutamine amidotransferase
MTGRAVTVVDYGVGNLLSVARAFEYCGANVELTGNPKRIAAAERLVLPGVGAFGDCMKAFLSLDLQEPLLAFIGSGRPIIGLCVGMQMLFDHSIEFGSHAGLGIMPGNIEAIPKETSLGAPQKVPHIGWTGIRPQDLAGQASWTGTILDGLSPGEAMYFVHSYTAWPSDPNHRLADASYGGQRIAAAVARDNLNGTQFHPEKSGRAGLRLLSNFIAL